MWTLRSLHLWADFLSKVSHLQSTYIQTILYFKLILLDIYINLAIETKCYLDVVATGVGIADARIALLAFWDTMPLNKAWEDIGKEDFFEVMNRSQKERKPVKTLDLSGVDRFQVVGAPPAKTATRQQAIVARDDGGHERPADDVLF